MGTTVILLACLTRLSCLAPDGELPAAERPAMPQFARIQLAVIWVVSLVVLAATQIPAARAARAWNDYLRVSLAQTTMNLNQFSQANDPAYIERQKRENGDRTRLMARYLEEVLARDPRDARAHARLAYQCVRVFEELQMRSENAIDLVSLSDAALASHFPDVATQDRWLQAAVGENRRWLDLAQYHLYQALHISPLQGNAYLHLSQIAFLQGIDRKGSRRLLEQAHRVRPYEASVLFGLGRDAMLRGDHSTAMVFWKQAFHQSDEYREQIILQLAGASSATEFVEYFEPDEEGIRILFAFYRGADLESQAREIAPLLATRQCEKARALEGRDAANMWENANQTFRYLENSAESLACARQAVEAAPLRYQSRLLLAQELVRCSQWSEALDALDWCMLRRPQDTTLQRMHRAASRGLAHGAVARSQSQTTKSGR